MTLADIGIVVGLTLSITGVSGTAGKYYLDHEYIPVGALQKAFDERDVRDLKRDIRKLEWLKKNGQITPQQDWELEGLYKDLGDLTQ